MWLIRYYGHGEDRNIFLRDLGIFKFDPVYRFIHNYNCMYTL